MRLRRPTPVDVLLVVLVAVGQLELWLSRHGSPPISLVVLHLMSPGALLVRRRTPFVATLVTLAAEAAVIQLEQSTLSACGEPTFSRAVWWQPTHWRFMAAIAGLVFISAADRTS